VNSIVGRVLFAIRGICGVILALSIVDPVYAWAPEGHEIIAIVAEQRLEPKTRKAVEVLLGGESFVKAAKWADQVQPARHCSKEAVESPCRLG
jgi:hypothetical protein